MQLVLFNLAAAQEFTDYCALLGEDDIQGKKHGFLAGNKVYYVGGTSLVWQNTENETLGLTHPFFHDLRSRGTGIAYHEGVGTGNDFYGWEFHRETRVAYGSIVSEETRWETPAPSQMFWRPDRMVVQYELSKDGETAANIKEEKFIASNDVVSSTITSDRPLKLEVTGQSFGMEKRIVSLNGRCSFDPELNSILVLEGGRVTTKVSNDPIVEKEGALVYDGMTGVLSSSRPLENVTLYEVRPGVCGYSFTIQLDSKGTTLSWTMHDDQNSALEAVQEVLADPSGYMEAKTRTMNNLLNNVVPYFRCSDDDIVKIYYYLWSLHLMYYTQGDQGMQMFPHTQTAVNNFLGLHRYSHKNLLSDISLDRYDAMFQILVGSWVSPAQHDFYANGNVLAWSQLLPFKNDFGELPDNFGVDWVSGVYGGSAVAHPIGAWQIFEHSGNTTFLALSYGFYKELFWNGIRNKVWGYAYDAVLCLNKMAEVLGYPEDAEHWNATVGMDSIPHFLESGWEVDTPNIFGSTTNGIPWSSFAYAAMSMFPREWVEAMAVNWLDNPVDGFLSDVPLCRFAMQDLPEREESNGNFHSVPDGNWFMIRGLYMHNVDALANKFTLAHLKSYNMEWGIPVAPESRRMDNSLAGDEYSNFNAGKILLILEGIGGLHYSTQDDEFTFADNLPVEWTFMEFRVPVVRAAGEKVSWVKARAERREIDGREAKVVTVENNPFKNLILRPWLEGNKNTTEASSADEGKIYHGHSTHNFENTKNANVMIQF